MKILDLFIKFFFWLILPKTLHYQGLILKKRFAQIEGYRCIDCYFNGKNRACPEDKKGNLKCKEHIYFKKVNKVFRGLGSSKWSFRAKCYFKSNLNRIKNELDRKNK